MVELPPLALRLMSMHCWLSYAPCVQFVTEFSWSFSSIHSASTGSGRCPAPLVWSAGCYAYTLATDGRDLRQGTQTQRFLRDSEQGQFKRGFRLERKEGFKSRCRGTSKGGRSQGWRRCWEDCQPDGGRCEPRRDDEFCNVLHLRKYVLSTCILIVRRRSPSR